MLTSHEFAGLARGKLRGKLNTAKPSVKVQRRKSIRPKIKQPKTEALGL